MKFLLTTCFAITTLLIQAQPPDVPATPGSFYGATTTADGAIALAEVPNLLKQNPEQSLKIKAKVLDVCPKKGCWMSLELPGKTKVFVKMKDYGFFVPLAAIGKTVVIDGNVKIITTSVDELRHYAEDAKKSKEEIDAITEAKEEIRLTANGILIVE